MRESILPLVCGLLGVLGEVALAHGGQYRGPGDVQPPSGSAGSAGQAPRTGGPAGPPPPNPATPGSGGAPAPAAGSGFSTAAATRRGVAVGPDLSRWQFWWEFNKDPFLRLKEAVHAHRSVTRGSDEFYLGGERSVDAMDTLRPSRTEIMSKVLPALKRALDSTDQRDITSACMVALGKIGRDHTDFRILPLLRARLRSRDQEIRETAALAMGISRLPAAVDDLIALVGDAAAGRQLCDRFEVDDRTRSFAAYGLGLIAHARDSADAKRRILGALAAALADETVVNFDLKIAAINAIRLLRPLPEAGAKHRYLLEQAVATLWRYYRRDLGKDGQLVQAHVPPAIARLLGRGGDATGRYKEAMAAELTTERRNNRIYQSAAIALGILCEPGERTKADGKYSAALLDYFRNGKNEQARYFCLMALAKIGGEANRGELARILATGNKALVKPWAALALGVLGFRARREAGESPAGSRALGEALHRQLAELKNGETQSAIAVALGLLGHREAADDMRQLLVRNRHRDELAGYLCIGLALMADRRSVDTIRQLVTTSIHRPDLLKQASVALGKLGDKRVAEILMEILADGGHNIAVLSGLASALAMIGDRRTIDPLVATMLDESRTDLARAFAAVALGGVAEDTPLPWNSKLAVDMNYRASVGSLTNQASGVLDIL